ncbi:MAG: IclR family transcriptional regulator [Gemmatimonadota bacterium]
MKHHPTNEGSRPTGTQAVARAFSILGAFGDANPEWGLADLSRSLGLTRTTTLRLLSALEREGMVSRYGVAGAYRLGPRAIELGALAQRSNTLHDAAHGELELLAHETGETTSLEVLVGSDVLILDEVQGRHKLSPAPVIGARWPAHAASTGKVLLAARRRGEGLIHEEAPAAAPLIRLTPSTITSRARLNAELDRVSEQGFAIAVEELEDGYVAVGAPVRNHQGHIVAAISVGGPLPRFGPDRLNELVGPVRQCAERISRRLGAGGAPRLVSRKNLARA